MAGWGLIEDGGRKKIDDISFKASIIFHLMIFCVDSALSVHARVSDNYQAGLKLGVGNPVHGYDHVLVPLALTAVCDPVIRAAPEASGYQQLFVNLRAPVPIESWRLRSEL